MLHPFCNPKQLSLFKKITDKMHADGKVLAVKPERNTDCRHTDNTCRNSEHISEIHVERIFSFITDTKRRKRRCRPGYNVNLFKGLPIPFLKDASCLLSLFIVSIIISGRKNISACQTLRSSNSHTLLKDLRHFVIDNRILHRQNGQGWTKLQQLQEYNKPL